MNSSAKAGCPIRALHKAWCIVARAVWALAVFYKNYASMAWPTTRWPRLAILCAIQNASVPAMSGKKVWPAARQC